jgi:hypothetical protein
VHLSTKPIIPPHKPWYTPKLAKCVAKCSQKGRSGNRKTSLIGSLMREVGAERWGLYMEEKEM